MIKRKVSIFLTAVLLSCSLFPRMVMAAPAESESESETDTGTVNTVPPSIEAESAVLMDAETGIVLYEKNSHIRQYPASITKIMTALLAQENCDMDEVITFSHNAVYTVERGSSNIGIDEKETLTMEDALYALLLASANEVANGIAEHVAGSVDAFADLMNEKAKELGCEDTHFVNPHGLPDDNHYTSAYDMALIARAFFSYDNLSSISGTAFYHINATATQQDEIDLGNHNKMLPGTNRGSKYYYEGLVGGKTGYTDIARQTLVTCAERDGVRLICVVMKDESPSQYKDSAALYDYGFANYREISVWDVADGQKLTDEACRTAENMTGMPYQVIEDPSEKDAFLLIKNTSQTSDLTYTTSFDEENSQVTFWFADGNREAGSVVVPVYEIQQFQDQQQTLTDEGNTDVISGQIQVADTNGKNQGAKNIFVGILKVLFGILLAVTVVFVVFAFLIRKKIEAERERARRRKELMERRRRRQEQERSDLTKNEEDEEE